MVFTFDVDCKNENKEKSVNNLYHLSCLEYGYLNFANVSSITVKIRSLADVEPKLTPTSAVVDIYTQAKS